MTSSEALALFGLSIPILGLLGVICLAAVGSRLVFAVVRGRVRLSVFRVKWCNRLRQ